MTRGEAIKLGRETQYKEYSASQLREAILAMMPYELDRIRAEHTGQTIQQRKITSEYTHV